MLICVNYLGSFFYDELLPKKFYISNFIQVLYIVARNI
jgi:hypothetical protein